MAIILPPISFVAMVIIFFQPGDQGRKRYGAPVTVVPAPVRGPASTPKLALVPKVEPGQVAEVSAAAGEAVYNTYCVACHQPEGKGKVGFAPYIRNPHFLSMTSDAFLKATITQGRPGTAMTPWAFLKPNEIDSVIAYLRSAEDPEFEAMVTVDADLKHAGEAGRGKAHYTQYCASCHGANANGYAEGGPGPAIGNAGFLVVASDDYIFQTVKHGRIGTAMRPFSGAHGLANLSDGEIGDVIAYLRNLGDAPPPVASAAPDPGKGKMHYDANCAACHQPNGAGRPGFAPSIGNRDFLALASDELIKTTVKSGRIGTAMVARPDLSDEVVGHIIAYLRSLPVVNVVQIEVDATVELASRGDLKAGHEKFGLYCAACHGPEGRGYVVGGAGPGIGLPGFLGSVSDDYILKTLTQGRINTAMRPFIGARGLANLNEQDACDIIAYMRSLDTSEQ